MQLQPSLLCFSALSLLTAGIAQTPQSGELSYTIGSTAVRRIVDGAVVTATMSRDGGATWLPLQQPDDRLRFLLAEFDPLAGAPQYPGALGAPANTQLLLVQFHTQVLADYRAAVTNTGGEILYFMPADALFVRADAAGAARLRTLPCVRWVGPLQNAFKLDAELRAFLVSDGQARELNLMLATKKDKPLAAAQVARVGGKVTEQCEGSFLLRASLTPAQLRAMLAFDTVVYADAVTEIGFDMDNARIQGGANYIETMGGYLGQGVRAEISEYFQETHPDFVGRFINRTNGIADHGHCTAGIVAGAGANNPSARGMMPQCTVIEGGYTSAGSHYAQIVGGPMAPWNTMQVTSSWGSTQTSNYTTVSANVDDALFDADFVRTQSMSNTGTTSCRPEAWPKNSISVGGVSHGNNANPLDDVWTSASIGPAQDLRLKPETCAYYDNVLTSDRTGASGYNSAASPGGDYYTGFNGTSSATPIVSGHCGLIQQLFTDGLFGNPLPLPATNANRFQNRSHASTVKALLCNTAAQYTFSGLTHNLTRVHQGWGFPSLQRLYDNRDKIVVLDEYDTLQVAQSRTYFVYIAPGTPEFRVTTVWADPAGLPSPSITLINNANLKVTRLSDNTFWWGNNGLNANMFSTAGFTANDRDNLEAVYLQNPQPGLYSVDVTAASIAQDAKVETPQVDMDFALVMHPMGGGYRTSGGLTFDLTSTGPGNLAFEVTNVPATGWTDGYTLLSLTTVRAPGFGNLFGLEFDALTSLSWTSPAFAGNLAHFTNSAGVYPFASVTFPDPALISMLAGIKLDGAVVLWNNSDVVAVSNIDRITLQ